jgi:poly(3-hydroxyalkanoate) synthetase
MWPLAAAASAGLASASFFQGVAESLTSDNVQPDAPSPWATPNDVVLELPTMRLRDFSTHAQGRPTLVCAPYALHPATIADFAPGHSLVEALRNAGLPRVFVTDWRSATPEMRDLSIDSYLADLDAAVDRAGAPADIIGLCQGGWMALVYAALFPHKVRRLVLAGAPVDIRAGESLLSRLIANVPLSVFENLVRFGGGRVLGRHVLDMWASVLAADEADRILQVAPDSASDRLRELEARFREWYATTVDLPGAYYLQIVRCLFKENQIAEGRFVALDQTVDLARIRAPVFLLAARDDELVAPEQLFATARIVGTAKAAIELATEPCSHLSLFIGARTLAGTWRRIAEWLERDPTTAPPSRDSQERQAN